MTNTTDTTDTTDTDTTWVCVRDPRTSGTALHWRTDAPFLRVRETPKGSSVEMRIDSVWRRVHRAHTLFMAFVWVERWV